MPEINGLAQFPWSLHEGKTAVTDRNGDIVTTCGFLPKKSVIEQRAIAELISMMSDVIEALGELYEDVEAKNAGDYSGNVCTSAAGDVLGRVERIVRRRA